MNHEPLNIKTLVSYEERKLEDSYSDYRVDTDGSAHRTGNNLLREHDVEVTGPEGVE